MFEYPLVHPTRDTPSLLLVDSSITGVGLALGLRLAYTGSRSMVCILSFLQEQVIDYYCSSLKLHTEQMEHM